LKFVFENFISSREKKGGLFPSGKSKNKLYEWKFFFSPFSLCLTGKQKIETISSKIRHSRKQINTLQNRQVFKELINFNYKSFKFYTVFNLPDFHQK